MMEPQIQMNSKHVKLNSFVVNFEVFKGKSKEQKKKLYDIFKAMDSNGNGSIEYTEFLAATISEKEYLQEKRLYKAFRMFDVNGDGLITAEELKEVLEKNNPEQIMSVQYYLDIIREIDLNGDGKVFLPISV